MNCPHTFTTEILITVDNHPVRVTCNVIPLGDRVCTNPILKDNGDAYFMTETGVVYSIDNENHLPHKVTSLPEDFGDTPTFFHVTRDNNFFCLDQELNMRVLDANGKDTIKPKKRTGIFPVGNNNKERRKSMYYHDVSLSPDEKNIIICTENGVVRIYDIHDNTMKDFRLYPPSGLNDANIKFFSARYIDNMTAIVAGEISYTDESLGDDEEHTKPIVMFVNIESGEFEEAKIDLDKRVTSIPFLDVNGEGKVALGLNVDHDSDYIVVYDIQNDMTPLKTIQYEDSGLSYMKFSQDGIHLVYGNTDRVYLENIKSGKKTTFNVDKVQWALPGKDVIYALDIEGNVRLLPLNAQVDNM